MPITSKKWKDSSKKEKKVAIIAITIIALVVIGVIGADTSNYENTEQQPQTNNQQGSEPAPEAKPEVNISEEVEAKFLEFWGFESTKEFLTASDMPDSAKIYGFINGFEDINSTTVRVYVQTDINEEEAKYIGKHIMGAVGSDIENLSFIVVRGTNGLDVNISRDDVPALRR